jgi:hypothetical protein
MQRESKPLSTRQHFSDGSTVGGTNGGGYEPEEGYSPSKPVAPLSSESELPTHDIGGEG